MAMNEAGAVRGVRQFPLPSFRDADGELVVAQSPEDLRFDLRRAFLIFDVKAGGVRGQHAHRSCSQVLIAASGEIEVVIDDGRNVVHESLHTPRVGLLLPPLIWSTQIFKRDGSVLLVLADGPYDEAEYVRSRSEFEQLAARRSTDESGT